MPETEEYSFPLSKPRGPGVVYVIQSSAQTPVKIGFTSHNDVSERLSGLQTGNPYPLRILATAPATISDERTVHMNFAAERLSGEWFELSPRVQLFVENLGVYGVVSALEEALLVDAPTPTEWMGLAIQETRAHLLFGLRKAHTFYEARKHGEGASVFRQYQMNRTGTSFLRYYLVSEAKRWLVDRKIVHRLNKGRLGELTVTVAELEQLDREIAAYASA